MNRLTLGKGFLLLVCLSVVIVIVLRHNIFKTERSHVIKTSLHEPIVLTKQKTNASMKPQTSLNGTTVTNQANAPTRFVYLTQTENCISTYLKSLKVFGDSEACQCDVIILSFKKECADKSLPHFQFLFKPHTTYTAGRNLLYEAARKRIEKYIYYIFLDDDVLLENVDNILHRKSERNPWRMFEESLKVFQPAVVILLSWTNENVFPKPKELLPERVNCELTEYIQIYRMDATVNAFHYQAIDHVLPYTAKYDSVSWWYPQMYLTIRCNIRFNGQVVVDPRFRTRNQQHRNYPRKHHTDQTLHDIVSDIRPEVPEKYKISVEPIFQQWLLKRDSKWLLGRRTCKRDLSAHPYKPYENLNQV